MDAETIVRTYSDMIYGIAYRYARNPTNAEDIYSEVFLSYFKKERTFESEEHRKAWLIRTTINAAKAFFSANPEYVELNNEITAAKGTREDGTEAIDLQSAVLKLPELQREVICMFYWQDLTTRQIAEIVGKSEENVRVILSRARAKLRVFLEE